MSLMMLGSAPDQDDGKKLFRTHCASCHGVTARGDGPLAELLLVAPADLTQISTRNKGVFPQDKVYRMIEGRERVKGHGSSDMPIWGNAFKKSPTTSDEEVRQKITALTHYVRSLQVAGE